MASGHRWIRKQNFRPGKETLNRCSPARAPRCVVTGVYVGQRVLTHLEVELLLEQELHALRVVDAACDTPTESPLPIDEPSHT